MATAAAAVPVVFDFLGYHFQAGPLIVGIAGVVASRQVIPLQSGTRTRWAQEIPVMMLCIFVTALLVQDIRSLLYAGVTGIGIGSLGVGVIGIIDSQFTPRFRAALAVFLGGVVPPPDAPPARPARPAPQDDDRAAIDAAMDTLDRHP